MPGTLSTSQNAHGHLVGATLDFATVKKLLTGHRALVMDEDSASFGRLFLSLSTAGCPATLARRWAQVDPAVRRVNPTLVIFSTHLEEMAGTEIVRRLREMPATRTAILVARADRESKSERRKLLDGGCDGYLSRPADRYLFAMDLLAGTPRLLSAADNHASF